MRQQTKDLLVQNHQQESLLSPDFQSVLNNMITYLRAARLPYSLQEQAHQQIIQLFLSGQQKGFSPEETVGMDYKAYCDALLGEFSQNNRRIRILCAIRDASLALDIGTAILFLTDLVTCLMGHQISFSLQMGKVIFLLSLVVFAFSFLKNAGKKRLCPCRKAKIL